MKIHENILSVQRTLEMKLPTKGSLQGIEDLKNKQFSVGHLQCDTGLYVFLMLS
jgi:hypothetical protein